MLAFYNLLETNKRTIDEKYPDKNKLDKWRASLRKLKEAEHDPKAINKWLNDNKAVVGQFVAENGAIPKLQEAWQELGVAARLEVVPLGAVSVAAITPLLAALGKVEENESKRPEDQWDDERAYVVSFLEESKRDTTLAELQDFIIEQDEDFQEFLSDCKAGAEKDALAAEWLKFKEAVKKDYLQQRAALGGSPMATVAGTGPTSATNKLVLLDRFLEAPEYKEYKRTDNPDGSSTLAKEGDSLIFSADGSKVTCSPKHYDFVVEGFKAKGFTEVIITPNGSTPDDLKKLKAACAAIGLKVREPARDATVAGTTPAASSTPIDSVTSSGPPVSSVPTV
ncbi:hypothetical protein BH10PSE19_BH10PSE19_09040 [soil metagenome]